MIWMDLEVTIARAPSLTADKGAAYTRNGPDWVRPLQPRRPTTGITCRRAAAHVDRTDIGSGSVIVGA